MGLLFNKSIVEHEWNSNEVDDKNRLDFLVSVISKQFHSNHILYLGIFKKICFDFYPLLNFQHKSCFVISLMKMEGVEDLHLKHGYAMDI